MTKQEFESMTIRENGGHITPMLYDTIERFYLSDNEYHQTHGGADETKQAFCKRVFGGKVNTSKTVLAKIIKESLNENRYALRGIEKSNAELDKMDDLIKEQMTFLSLIEY